MAAEPVKTDLDFDATWERICGLTGWKTYGELADFLSIKSPSVSGAKKRGIFPLEWVYKVAQGFSGSTDWLATGKKVGKQDDTPDEALLQAVIESVEQHLSDNKTPLTPSKKAQIVTALYLMSAKEKADAVDKAAVARLVKLAV